MNLPGPRVKVFYPASRLSDPGFLATVHADLDHVSAVLPRCPAPILQHRYV